MTTLIILAEAGSRPLFLPAPVFGIIALSIFAVMGFMVFTYRDVANRHSHKTDKSGSGHH